MTTLHHISAVRAIISNGPASDDLSFSDRLISHFLQITRATLQERKADKYRQVADQTFQSVCLSLELGTFHNCCNVPNLECYILKSVIPLPQLLSAKWGNFLQVMDLSGNVLPEFNLTNNKFASYGILEKNIGWFIHDNYLYVINNKKLEKVLVNGLFFNPTEISQINCASGIGSCLDYGEEEFPVDPDLVEPMYKATIDYLLASTRMVNDIENNAKDPETAIAKQ